MDKYKEAHCEALGKQFLPALPALSKSVLSEANKPRMGCLVLESLEPLTIFKMPLLFAGSAGKQ